MAISYNVPITFGRNGTAKGLNCGGIDFSEGGTQSWTSAQVAELDIQLPPARQDVIVQIEASPFIIPTFLPPNRYSYFWVDFSLGIGRLKPLNSRRSPSIVASYQAALIE